MVAPEENSNNFNRRELLKALAATGGAVTAASLLPGQWVKPVVEAGLLPAHAQASALLISNLNATPARVVTGQGLVDFDFWNVTFNFDDALGNVGLDTLLNILLTFEAGSHFLSGLINAVGGSFLVNNDGFDGTIQFLLAVPYGALADICKTGPSALGAAETVCEAEGDSTGDDGVELKVTIKTADGRTSNSLTIFLNRISASPE